jgi:hypothetical protein
MISVSIINLAALCLLICHKIRSRDEVLLNLIVIHSTGLAVCSMTEVYSNPFFYAFAALTLLSAFFVALLQSNNFRTQRLSAICRYVETPFLKVVNKSKTNKFLFLCIVFRFHWVFNGFSIIMVWCDL